MPAPTKQGSDGLEPEPSSVTSCERPRDDLIQQGWQKRFLASSDRAEEFARWYRSLGFEVHLEKPQASKVPSECRTCLLDFLSCVMIYTRHESDARKSGQPSREKDRRKKAR